MGGALLIAGAALLYYFYSTFTLENTIEPEIFQQFNPIMIVFLTPVVVALFAFLRKRNIEPSSPRKIGIGMILAATGFMLIMFTSFGLVSPAELHGEPSPDRVSSILVDQYIHGTHLCRAFPESDGTVVCVEGSATTIPGIDAGWLAGCNCCWELASFYWIDGLFSSPVMASLADLCGVLPPCCRFYFLYYEKAGGGDKIEDDYKITGLQGDNSYSTVHCYLFTFH